MNPKEKKLRDKADLISESYIFWDSEVERTILRADELVEKFSDSDEERNLYEQLQDKLGYFIGHLEFEKREMSKLEKEIQNFMREDEGQ